MPEPARPLTPPAGCALVLDRVGFAYPGGAPVLEEVSATLPEGGTLVVTGPSGAGKSTLVALLCRFREPTAGRILVGGRDLRRLRGDDVRALAAVVTQDAQVFAGTVRENLRLADPAADGEAMREALRRAGLGDWLRRLPEGLDSWIGERGVTLSGGERQRLALARAVLQDRPLWILDEPTAHLDDVTAAAVLREILEASQGRTRLVVTHRPDLVPGPHRCLALPGR